MSVIAGITFLQCLSVTVIYNACLLSAVESRTAVLNTCVLRNVSYSKTCPNTLLNRIYAAICVDKKVSVSLLPRRLLHSPGNQLRVPWGRKQRERWMIQMRGMRGMRVMTGKLLNWDFTQDKAISGCVYPALARAKFSHRDSKWGFF